MLRLTIAVVSISLLAAGGAGTASTQAVPAAAQPAPVFAVSGRGFGHGVGMSQYGALGLAQAGAGHASILAHYYPGTVLGRAAVAQVRVLLAEGRPSVRVASATPFRVRGGDGAVHAVPAGVHLLGPELRVRTAARTVLLRPPLLVQPGPALLQLDGKRYRGALELAPVQGRLRVVNVVGLEQYLLGVVPREVSPRWPLEALKAQAVAARSYALAKRRSGPFDLYPDERSQVYGGVAAEHGTTTAAVQATAGEVLRHGGRVATTYFYSTSGGRTANVGDVWPGSPPVPYLVSVDDPHDAVSPHHAWGPLRIAPARLQSVLGVKGALRDVRTTTTPSGRVARVVGVGTGGQTSVPAASVRTALGLRSTWFQVGVLALDRPARASVVFGSQLQLTGLARDLPGAVLEQRVGAGAWTVAETLAPAASGTFAAPVRPGAPTQYRLAAGSVRTGAVAVGVAPLVQLAPPTDPTLLGGTVRPLALAGANVVVQRLEGGEWKRIAAARIDENGAFSARASLAPGRYRASVPAARGFLAGASTPLEVVAP
jgi:stage II sporulation protein D